MSWIIYDTTSYKIIKESDEIPYFNSLPENQDVVTRRTWNEWVELGFLERFGYKSS